MKDGRLDNGLADVKAGAAAFNDAHVALREMLDEGPRLPEPYRLMLEQNCAALGRLVMRSNAVIGSLTRIVEETPGGVA